MSTEHYIRDPRFEAHGCAVKLSPDLPAKWWDRGELPQLFSEVDWSTKAILCHHAQFDGLILSHHYGVRPRFWLDTLSMARLLLGNHLSVSLDAVRKHFGIPAKLTPYNLFRGKHWSELDSAVKKMVADGACDEVESVFRIFCLLGKDFPREEYAIVDMVVKMFTQPVLGADVGMLRDIWRAEAVAKQARAAALAVDEAELRSADRFADLLRAAGVEPEVKNSPTDPGRQIWAFAKTDPFMESLLDHDDERVRALAEARIGAKATTLQTRAATLGGMLRRGDLCVYKHYCGAHTTRMSGGDGTNFENLKSDAEVPAGEPTIRRAIKAPPGWVLVKPDASQIECRLLNFVAGQDDKVEEFRQGKDPYVGVASAFAGFPVTKAEHPALRQAGKVVELQAGYQSGAAKIQGTLRIKAKIIVDLPTAERWKKGYRDTHPAVEHLWRTAGRMIARIAGGDPLAWGPSVVRDGAVWLPNGCAMRYPDLQWHVPTDEEREKLAPFKWDGFWRYRSRKGWVELYGGKLVENWIQGLARVVVFQAAARIAAAGHRIVNTEHDSLWILLPGDARLEHNKQAILAEMSREPVWLPGIPLAAEMH